jgi:ankyrin repeat protein
MQISSDKGATPLHYALFSPEPNRIVRSLLGHGADTNILCTAEPDDLIGYSDYYVLTLGGPLHCAVRIGNLETVRILLEGGANPNLKDENGTTPLQYAIRDQRLDLLREMMPYATKDRENLPEVDNMFPWIVGFFQTPLFRKIYWIKEQITDIQEVVECFKEHAIALDEQGILGAGLDADNPEIVDLYIRKLGISKGAELPPFRFHTYNNPAYSVDVSFDLASMLNAVVLNSSLSLVKTVLMYMRKPISSKGFLDEIYLGAVGNRQNTSRAETNGIIDALIAAGAKMDVTNSIGKGPLWHAVLYNNFEALEGLLDQNPTMKDLQGAFGVCIRNGFAQAAVKMLRCILEKHLEVLLSPPDDTGASYGNFDTAHIDTNYLRVLCNVPERSRDDTINNTMLRDIIDRLVLLPNGKQTLEEQLKHEMGFWGEHTPLHAAVFHGNLPAIETLLAAGADVNFCSNYSEGESLFGNISSFPTLIPEPTSNIQGNLANYFNTGPTPLDWAQYRDWVKTLQIGKPDVVDQARAVWFAGGATREKNKYDTLTRRTIQLLKNRGGKTRAQLFGMPESAHTVNPVRTASSGQKEDLAPSTLLKSEKTAILSFLGLACSLPYATLSRSDDTEGTYPPSSTRVPLSILFSDLIPKFEQLLRRDEWNTESEGPFDNLNSLMAKLKAWNEDSGASQGLLDNLDQEITQRLSLAQGIRLCMRDINHNLDRLEQALREAPNLK